MTVAVVMLSLAPILWESGIGSDVMKPIGAPDETDRCSDRRRNDNVDHPRSHSGASVLCDHERARASSGHA
jgi:hypothetical protein